MAKKQTSDFRYNTGDTTVPWAAVGENYNTEDVNTLTEECYIKPVESDIKIFIINHGETMTTQAQNKLLKTLEEPPKNVFILIGATNSYAFLPTVLSRVNKVEIPQFSDETLFNALKEEYADHEKLKTAISCGDGTVGKAVALYGDEATEKAVKDFLSVAVLTSKKMMEVEEAMKVIEDQRQERTKTNNE